MEKIRESVASVLPIALIVAAVSFTAVPVPTDLMLSFLIGTALLIVGMGLFTLGSEQAMTPIGSHIGAKMTKSRKLGRILVLSLLLGVAITIAEPDLQVLAGNVPHIDSAVLILTVSVGVGLFLLLCMLRILFAIPLRWLLLGFYLAAFVLAFFSDRSFLGVAFDSGGVTTGPITVPFIMAMGVGVASIRSDRNAGADSFGLVALCSIGPVLAVMALGFFYPAQSSSYSAGEVVAYRDTAQLGLGYLRAFPAFMKEVALALSPVFLFFLLFQALSLKLRRRAFLRILIGVGYTYVGLVLFLAGVNVGFSPLGVYLGRALSVGWLRFLLIPLSMLMGWFIISAEPAVHVLNRQVEEISAGAVSARAMGLSLSVAIAAAMGLSMLRILAGIPILWLLIPGYALALGLSFFVPPMFTAIAFDSGGVASGPMTATFMLPFAMGASELLGRGAGCSDAFGLVALVAMLPLITIQIMGVVYVRKTRRAAPPPELPYADDEIIELWEVV